MALNLKKKRYLLVALLAVMVILLGSLPFLLSTGPALNFFVAKINSKIPGNLTIGSWLVGWQQGFLCQDISYVDPARGIRVVIPRLTSTQGLLELVVSSKNLGQVALESPLVELTSRRDNVKNTPVGRVDSEDSPGVNRAPVWEELTAQVEVRGGQLRVKAGSPEREAGFKDIVLHSFLADGVVNYDLGFHLTGGQGSVDLAGTLNLPARQSAWIDTLVTETEISVAGLQVKDFLALASLKTNLPEGQGVLNGDIAIRTSGLHGIEVNATIDLADLKLSGGYLGQDSPSFQKIHVEVDEAEWSKQRWAFRKLGIESDTGTLQAESRYDSGKTTLQGQGKVDLPVLFDQFPNLLKLQESTLIETGDLDFDVDLAASARKINLNFKGRIDSLGGLFDGQPFSWDKPVAVILDGERSGSEVNVNRFRIEAPFIEAAGRGNLDAFDLEAEADLDQTFIELSKLFRMQWFGSGMLDMNIKANSLAADGEKYRLNADFNIDGFSLHKGERLVVPKHNLSLIGSGYAPVSMLRERHGSVDLQFALSSWLGEIFLVLDADRRKDEPWSGSYSTDTNINLHDVSEFLYLVEALSPATKMTGDVQVQAAGNFAGTYFGVRELETVISDFVLDRDGVEFTDRNMHLRIAQSVNDEVSSLIVHDLIVSEDKENFMETGAGSTGINFKNHSVYLYDIMYGSDLGNAEIKQFILQDWKQPFDTLASNIRFTTDLTRLTSLVQSTGILSKDIQLQGTADVLLDTVSNSRDTNKVVAQVELDDFGLQKQDKNYLNDEDAEFSVQLEGNLVSGNVQLKKLLLSSVPLDLDAHGIVIRTGDRNELELQGELIPDLAAISSVIKNGFDIDLAMQGRESKPFSIRYPLGEMKADERKDKVNAAAAISVESLQYQGIDIRSLTIPMDFKDSNLQLAFTGELNKGKLNLISDCDFRGKPPVIIVPEASHVLTGVQLDKPLVEGLLKKIHPLFGSLGEASGKLDVRLDSFTWPLIEQGGRDAVFVTVLDTSKVNFDSAGVLRSILAIFGLEHEKLSLRDSNIVCSGREGRISCSPIRILAAESEMVLRGSVGMDKSLDYMLQIPVTEKLVGREGFRVLEGTTVNVPIQGSIDSPVFDKEIVSAAVKDLMKQVASRVIVEQAGKVLPQLMNEVFVPQEKK